MGTCLFVMVIFVALVLFAIFKDRIFESEEQKVKRVVSERRIQAIKRGYTRRVEEILLQLGESESYDKPRRCLQASQSTPGQISRGVSHCQLSPEPR